MRRAPLVFIEDGQGVLSYDQVSQLLLVGLFL
jgi:hypothetical protein